MPNFLKPGIALKQHLMDGVQQFYPDGDSYVTEIDVPGFGHEDIDVTIEKKTLHVTGNKKSRTIDYSFAIPDIIDNTNIKATVEHGILTLQLPVKQEAQPRKIAVTSAG